MDFNDCYDAYVERFCIVAESEGVDTAKKQAFIEMFEDLAKTDLSAMEQSKIRTGVKNKAVNDGIVPPFTAEELTRSY